MKHDVAELRWSVVIDEVTDPWRDSMTLFVLKDVILNSRHDSLLRVSRLH